MRFDYQFRTKDNELRSASLHAPSRDAAYAALKKAGINPSRVELAPGLLNRVSSLGKRGLAIVILALATVGLAIALGRARTPRVAPPSEGEYPAAPTADRHQLAGLPADWVSRLPAHLSPVDAYFALFAQPGCRDGLDIVIAPGSITAELLESPMPAAASDEPGWVTELRPVVAGIREEVLALIRRGKTPDEVVLWLRERQRMEAAYRQQILDGEGSAAEKQGRLATMGL